MPIIANTSSANTFSAVRAQLNSVTKRLNAFAGNESALYANTINANVSLRISGTDISATFAQNTYVKSVLANTNTYIATMLASSSYTAADVLSKLITVDGTGSGLDADTVDGIQGAAIWRKGTDIPTAADLNDYTTDGYYHQNANANAAAGTNYPVALAGMLEVTSDGAMVYQRYTAYSSTHIVYVRTYYSTTWYSWATQWSSLNDGTGSGLDADLWDGNQFASYLNQAVLTSSSPTFGTVSATHFDNVSDVSLKENIISISSPKDIIDNLNPVSFNWKDTGEKSFGFIAQEVENILPEIVHTKADGAKTVSYIQLIPFLIQIIKEQQQQIDIINNKLNNA
jgi:hypothetical protein